MQSLPRELLKWLQSLDLTYSVKNVKRDFSNGFLIAEIFSRYYVADVEMHSYDNGQSLQRKLDNWAQLNKFFKKKGIVVDKELINDVVHCKNLESPVQLVSSIYTQLTGREVKLHAAPPVGAATGSDPAFMGFNATALLNSKMRETEMATTLSDHSAAAARAKALMDDHEEDLRAQREAQPSRYGAGGMAASATQSAVLSGMLRASAPKPVQAEIQSAQVRFQEVRVQEVDRNIAQIRSSRDQAVLRSQSYATTAGGAPEPGVPLAGGDMDVPPPPPPGGEGRVSIADVLSRLVLPACPDAMFYLPAQSFASFLETLDEMPTDVILAVLAATKSQAADGIAAACRASPANGYELFALFAPALHVFDTDVFAAICDVLKAVGEGLATDKQSAYAVLTSYALPWLKQFLNTKSTSPVNMQALLGVVYAMVPPTPESHIDAIRALQNVVNDQAPFIALLPMLLTMEVDFSSDLIALYVYYCVLALDLDSKPLRASAIGMLVKIAGHNAVPILALSPKLATLADDGWWEVSAQLSRLCSVLLLCPDVMNDEASEAAALVGLVAKCLANRQPAAQLTALSSAAPLLGAYPALLPCFIESLLELGPEQRLAALQPSSQIILAKGKGDVLKLDPLPQLWPATLVASSLMSTARDRSLDSLDVAYVDVLRALLPAAAPEDKAKWASWLKENKDYLYVALCDEELCGPITEMLKPFFILLQDDALPTFSTLLSSLRMVCDNAPAACTTIAQDFVIDVAKLGEPFLTAMKNLCSNFEEAMRNAFPKFVAEMEK